MLLTMFLLGVVYVVLIVVAITAGVGIGAVFLIAAVVFGTQMFASDKIALAAMGARDVSPAQAPQLHSIIDRLCLHADIPKPRVALVQAPMPNAFALGRSQKTATVCVTTGLLSLLSEAELEGVLAHELTHVINRDVMVMTIASFFASIAAIAARFGFLFGGGRGRNQQGAFAIVLAVSIGVYAVSFVLLRALVALPRVRRRPRGGGDHRQAERPVLGVDEDQRHDGADPEPRPSRRQRDERVLHRSGAPQGVAIGAVRHPPAAREADRGPEPARGPAAERAVTRLSAINNP